MTAPAQQAPVQPQHRFRLDIEGLRALAVGFVLLHHASATLLPGGFAGVDMFFVVSGFVITTQLIKEVERTGTVNLPGFYARRAKRLLPAAGMVLIFTAISTWAFASRVQWSNIGTDIVGSSLYVVNWVFASRSVDYLAEDAQPSPLQHFWSLAVEEQFYVIWPLLIIGLATLATTLAKRRSGSRSAPIPRRAVLAGGLLVLVVLPSLAWSIYYTQTSPEQAYFVTTTRLWELGFGALVAVLAPTWKLLPSRIATIIAWTGLAGLVISMLIITTETAWPGSAALIPVITTSMVIIGGFSSGPTGPVTLLGLKPLVWIGGLSYSLYLWHWPLLRTGEWIFGEQGPYQGLAIVAFSFLPAWIGYQLVEKPIRYSKTISASPKFSLSLGANFTAIGVIAGLLLLTATSSTAESSPDEPVSLTNIDPAESTADDAESTQQPVDEPVDTSPLFDVITPDPTVVTTDLPAIYAMGCSVSLEGTDATPCTSDTATGDDLDVVLLGDSKAGQWWTPLETVAADNNWSLVSYTKSACSYADAMLIKDDLDYVECRAWNDQVREILMADPPDVVVTSALSINARAEDGSVDTQPVIDGTISYWQELADQGTVIVALSDTPQFPNLEDYGYPSVYECVADNLDTPNEDCAFSDSRVLGNRVLEPAADAVAKATFVDMNAYVCPGGTCQPVFRNVLMYRQGSHISDTFSQGMTRPLSEEIVPLIEASTQQ
ncbi:acyltransferase family protein [Ornithinimicrobium sp. INDO-MA30-4]|uniref:acyltransferase family protein n=1 Tax=Ornithinimicrobium sp. INDO-MA30-4 TaxID=2908651 RepID=UPI001F40A296|nr:acyltransferase family protein [Ornithinimicrobium sp. INDO-MA30-4]UJH69720.1 acyltransferase [Ornithinimicrobium sp. INDO-MA30-4]